MCCPVADALRDAAAASLAAGLHTILARSLHVDAGVLHDYDSCLFTTSQAVGPEMNLSGFGPRVTSTMA